MTAFVLKQHGESIPVIWEIDGVRLYNKNGGWHDYNPNDEDIIYTASAESFEDFSKIEYVSKTVKRIAKEFLLKPDSDIGWISPSGEFFRCAYGDHRAVASYIIESSEEDLENGGWVKISRWGRFEENNDTIWHISCRYPEKRMTKSQISAIKRYTNIDPDDYYFI